MIREERKIVVSRENIQVDELLPDEDTLPKSFLIRARHLSGRTAMRKKRYGIWQEYSWEDCWRHVHDICLGLVSLGLSRGEKVCLIGENDPEFYWAEIAAWSAGAITTAIYTDANLQELAYVIQDSDSVFLFAHDQEQCDKALALRGDLPAIRKVIYWDDKGMWGYDDPWLMRLEDLERLGSEYGESQPGVFEQMIAEGDTHDIAIFSYTSGTTSLPKGAMITHYNLLHGNRHASYLEPGYASDNFVSFTPMAWITEQSLGVAGHVSTGFTVNFPEGPDTVQNDVREIAPNVLLFPSRIWEGIASMALVRINDSTLINRLMFRVFMPVAYKIIDLEDSGKPVGFHWRLLRLLGEVAIFEPLRDKLGMVRLRTALTTGAALSPDFIRFFRAIGVQLKNLYGSTEAQTHTMHYAGNIKLASVGTPPPGVEVLIADNNEIWVRSRSVFKGYYKSPEKTAEAIDADGWFHTGDAGYIDEDNHLYYLDRVRDMIELANGELFSPQYIEIRLKFSQYIQDVMAVGGFDMSFVSAIIIIDFDNVARWAEKNRIAFTTFVDLSQRPEVYALIKQDVERVNETLPPPARVKKFVILHKTFDADEAELTRTRKLKRRVLEQKYGEMLDAMYSDRESVTVRAEVKYRDGRTGVVETAVTVCTV
jgi:long-chain acyl-CoA synthetase